MDANIILTILVIIAIICVLIAIVSISKVKIKEIKFEQSDIPKFSTDIQYDPYPMTVNIENLYDCNVNSLRVCDINDSTTLFGCKELIVRCHHFDKDTPYIENNVSTTIPKNSKPDEGYALAITTIADSCNPYHGDLTLIAVNAESDEYMLICTCKNPGYIGNESLLGNCTSVFICNGEIDNIDKPLNKISCICEKNQTNIRYEDGLPVCKNLLVHEANELFADWTHLVPWNSDRQLDISNFNVTISGNMNVTRLLNPCKNSIHDTSVEIVNGTFNSITRECNLLGYGIPISNGLLRYDQPDDEKLIGATSVLATGTHERIRFSDNIAGERKIYGLVVNGLIFNEEYKNIRVVVHPQNGMGLSDRNALNIITDDRFTCRSCKGSWPTYFCSDADRGREYSLGGLIMPESRSCPGPFLWSREEWEDNEFLLNRSIELSSNGLNLSAIKLSKVNSIRTYGVQYAALDSKSHSGILSFEGTSDYNIHKNVLTD